LKRQKAYYWIFWEFFYSIGPGMELMDRGQSDGYGGLISG
jgi:hypothetical protein